MKYHLYTTAILLLAVAFIILMILSLDFRAIVGLVILVGGGFYLATLTYRVVHAIVTGHLRWPHYG